MFFKTQYKNLNLIKISKNNLLNNYVFFEKITNTKVCPVLKSNAYGHGLLEVGKFVDQEIKPEFICVDSLFEAYELRKNNIKNKILILGYTFPENLINNKFDFRIPLFDLNTLEILAKLKNKVFVHLKIETGMNRLGIIENQYDLFINKLKNSPNIIVEGIYSHLADADNPLNNNFSKLQTIKFKEAVKYFEEFGFEFKYKHINATSGSIVNNDSMFNLSRIGLGFYGISPFDLKTKENKLLLENLKPSLSFVSHIVEIKKINKNETIGYGRTYKTKKTMNIAILPIGYNEGFDRRFSNIGSVLIDNKYCPIVGNICMNICMADVSEIKNPFVGQEVIIFSDKNENKNSIYNCANQIKTIPYEILTELNTSVKRIVE